MIDAFVQSGCLFRLISFIRRHGEYAGIVFITPTSQGPKASALGQPPLRRMAGAKAN